jgi:hypothetical protein
MKKRIPAAAARAIDATSEELMHEFANHAQEFQAAHPGDHDPRKLYEAWSIQKLAALQYTVLQLGEAITRLTTQSQKN